MLYLALLAASLQIEVQRMDSNVWKEREAAHKVVENMTINNDLCAMYLKEMSKNHKSFEVKRRVDDIMMQYYNVFPNDLTKLPCIDMIKDKKERHDAVAKYVQERGYYPNFLGLRYATHIYVYEKLKDGVWTRTKAVKFLKELADIEKEYVSKKSSNCYTYDEERGR
jgi:hypothetical protein